MMTPRWCRFDANDDSDGNHFMRVWHIEIGRAVLVNFSIRWGESTSKKEAAVVVIKRFFSVAFIVNVILMAMLVCAYLVPLHSIVLYQGPDLGRGGNDGNQCDGGMTSRCAVWSKNGTCTILSICLPAQFDHFEARLQWYEVWLIQLEKFVGYLKHGPMISKVAQCLKCHFDCRSLIFMVSGIKLVTTMKTSKNFLGNYHDICLYPFAGDHMVQTQRIKSAIKCIRRLTVVQNIPAIACRLYHFPHQLSRINGVQKAKNDDNDTTNDNSNLSHPDNSCVFRRNRPGHQAFDQRGPTPTHLNSTGTNCSEDKPNKNTTKVLQTISAECHIYWTHFLVCLLCIRVGRVNTELTDDDYDEELRKTKKKSFLLYYHKSLSISKAKPRQQWMR